MMAEDITTVGGIFSPNDPTQLPKTARETLKNDQREPSLQDLHKDVEKAAAETATDDSPGSQGGSQTGAGTSNDETGQTAEAEEAKRSAMMGRVALAAGGLMAIGLYDEVFVKAWNEQELFKKYTDPNNYEPAAAISVPLKEHEIKSVHKPKIEIRVNERVVRTINFTIDLTLKLTGAIVTIHDGKILKVEVGKCQVHGTLLCGELELADEEITELALVPETEFEEPIPILPPWVPAQSGE